MHVAEEESTGGPYDPAPRSANDVLRSAGCNEPALRDGITSSMGGITGHFLCGCFQSPYCAMAQSSGGVN